MAENAPVRSKDDQAALDKTKLAIARRNSGDATIHPTGQPHEFYSVLAGGKILFVYEHDKNSGLTPEQGLRPVFAAQAPDLYEEGVKPTLELIELAREG